MNQGKRPQHGLHRGAELGSSNGRVPNCPANEEKRILEGEWARVSITGVVEMCKSMRRKLWLDVHLTLFLSPTDSKQAVSWRGTWAGPGVSLIPSLACFANELGMS